MPNGDVNDGKTLVQILMERVEGMTLVGAGLASLTEPDKDDVDLGELPDKLKRLYLVRIETNQVYMSKQREIRDNKGHQENESNLGELEKLRDVAEMARIMFWGEVRYRIPAALEQTVRKQSLTIRHGWRLVAYKAQPDAEDMHDAGHHHSRHNKGHDGKNHGGGHGGDLVGSHADRGNLGYHKPVHAGH